VGTGGGGAGGEEEGEEEGDFRFHVDILYKRKPATEVAATATKSALRRTACWRGGSKFREENPKLSLG
jgi:hypothetical protein